MTFATGIGGLEAGFAMGAATIMSVGPNNLMMLRAGLAGERAGVVASLVFVSYGVLILAGWQFALLSEGADPRLETILTWSGLAAIVWFAWQSFRAAMANNYLNTRTTAAHRQQNCLFRVLAVVWMNPLTYLELVLIPAALIKSFGGPEPRAQFVLALGLMSAVCCYGYAFGGSLIAALLGHRVSLRLFDLVSGLLLAALAASMAAALVWRTTMM